MVWEWKQLDLHQHQNAMLYYAPLDVIFTAGSHEIAALNMRDGSVKEIEAVPDDQGCISGLCLMENWLIAYSDQTKEISYFELCAAPSQTC